MSTDVVKKRRRTPKKDELAAEAILLADSSVKSTNKASKPRSRKLKDGDIAGNHSTPTGREDVAISKGAKKSDPTSQNPKSKSAKTKGSTASQILPEATAFERTQADPVDGNPVHHTVQNDSLSASKHNEPIDRDAVTTDKHSSSPSDTQNLDISLNEKIAKTIPEGPQGNNARATTLLSVERPSAFLTSFLSADQLSQSKALIVESTVASETRNLTTATQRSGARPSEPVSDEFDQPAKSSASTAPTHRAPPPMSTSKSEMASTSTTTSHKSGAGFPPKSNSQQPELITTQPIWKTSSGTTARPSFPTKIPPKPLIPPTPPPKKPSELPYHLLVKDPRYKQAYRKYTAVLVAIPVGLVTSWVLWERLNGLKQQQPLAVPRRKMDESESGIS